METRCNFISPFFLRSPLFHSEELILAHYGALNVNAFNHAALLYLGTFTNEKLLNCRTPLAER